MKRVLLSLLTFVLFSASIYAQNSYSLKVDPLLRYQINEFNALDKSKDSPQMLTQKLKSLTGLEIINQEPFAGVFIKTSNPLTTKLLIEKSGGWVTTVAGDILVAKIPVKEINFIASFADINKIESNVNRQPQLDKSRTDIKADLVQAGQGIAKPLKGKGVVVGIVDSGIDFNHDDFKDATGKTKIQYLWDVSDNGKPAAGFNYGHEYTKANIDAGQCFEKDGNGHGTHVSGTAAGTGRAVSSFVGIAPEADIVFVKGTQDPNSQQGFMDVDVVNGCSYIFQKAASMGKPAVINLSLGGHLGAHDGLSNYEQALSNLTGPGKIIVVAAGNQGDGNAYVGWPHVGYTAGTTAQYTLLVMNDQASYQLIDLWFSSGDMEVGIAALDNNGNVLNGSTCLVNGDSAIKVLTYFDGTNTYTLGKVSIYTAPLDPTHNAKEAIIVMEGAQSFGGIVNWVLATVSKSNSKFDAWFVGGGNFSDIANSGFSFVKGDNVSTIGIPGTSKKVICVGSHVTKDAWTDENGNVYNQGTLGEISTFSSRGPTRDGRMKPDITAPGEVIVAAKSSQAADETQNIIFGTNGKLQKMQGTSMASPHVTGLVALMLQAKPTLNYDQALTILKQTARKDNFTGSNLPSNTWGSGKVNALAACVQALNMSGIEYNDNSVLKTTFSTFYPNPASNWATVEYNLPADSKVSLRVMDLFGREISTVCNEFQQAGFHTLDLDLKSTSGEKLTSGIYFYQLVYELNGTKYFDMQKISVSE